MNCSYFIGCDISKDKIDIAIVHNLNCIYNGIVANEEKTLSSFIKSLPGLVSGLDLDNSLFCMEFTGIYNVRFTRVLDNAKAHISVIHAAQIKKSIGDQRGKNDAVDAVRIAMYANRFTDQLKEWKNPGVLLEKLAHLYTLRDRLVDSKTRLEVPLKEAKAFLTKEVVKPLEKHSNPVIEAINQQISEVDREIQDLIDNDEDLKPLYQIIDSVPGIGNVIATAVIIETQAFKKFDNAKQFACHVGVVPFEKSSGSSLKSKPRVSHKAKKKLKCLFHLAALAAIQAKGELRNYYLRKVAEGKNKMSVINAVRNKIIQRLFACVKNQVMYQKNYQHSLAKP